MIRIIQEPGAKEPEIIFREVTDPAEIARSRAQHERTLRNSAWIQAHWADVLPHGRGKFLAVAGEQAFLADTDEEARALAEAAHPDDDGVFSMYLFPEDHCRVYANRR